MGRRKTPITCEHEATIKLFYALVSLCDASKECPYDYISGFCIKPKYHVCLSPGNMLSIISDLQLIITFITLFADGLNGILKQSDRISIHKCSF